MLLSFKTISFDVAQQVFFQVQVSKEVMEELEEIKLKVAEIKLSSLEREFEKANIGYLQTISALKLMLSQKRNKQNLLNGELENLKKQYLSHNLLIQTTLRQIAEEQSPIRNGTSNQKSTHSSKNTSQRLFKKKSPNISLVQKTIEGKSDNNSPLKTPSQENIISKEVLFPSSPNKMSLQLKTNTSLQMTMNKSPTFKIRSSYDVSLNQKLKQKVRSIKDIRSSEKMVINPESRPKLGWK